MRGPLYGVTDNYGNEGHNRFNYLMSKWVYKLTNKIFINRLSIESQIKNIIFKNNVLTSGSCNSF